ncbi:hypothetical protein ACVWYG_000079 [Pedobacter sp. UYEF25]
MSLLDVLNPLLPADKLKIESWEKIERAGASEKTFAAFINPDEITLNYSVLFDDSSANGKTGNAGTFLGTSPFEVTLKFFLDGTNSTGVPLDVKKKIIEFYETTSFDGESHRTRFLKILWPGLVWYRANQSAFDCVLKTANIQYKLFDKDGKPLRAVITATFTENRTKEEIEKENNKHSADLTHVRVVKEGDTLPAMVYKIYGDVKYYLEVAKVNKLTNFRDLIPGQKLVFPPFGKS